jgi:hypothetical protein
MRRHQRFRQNSAARCVELTVFGLQAFGWIAITVAGSDSDPRAGIASDDLQNARGRPKGPGDRTIISNISAL